MHSQLTRRRLLAAGAGATLSLLAGCTGMTPFIGQRITEEHSHPGEAIETIRVRGTVGSIDITGESRSEVHIDVVKQSSSLRTDLDDLTLETAVDGTTLEIRSEWAGETGWMESRPSLDMALRIPDSIAVDRVETRTGSIGLERVSGDITAQTQTGTITSRNVDGSIEAETDTGVISISTVDGAVSARSTTGRIEIQHIGVLDDVSSTTGSIDVEVPAIDGNTRITATTGQIEAAINPDIDAEIEARTSTGRIQTDGLPLESTGWIDGHLSDSLGDGGPTLSFETNTGGISLSAL